MDDLFDVFDEAPQAAPPKIEEIKDEVKPETTDNQTRSTKKRQLTTTTKQLPTATTVVVVVITKT